MNLPVELVAAIFLHLPPSYTFCLRRVSREWNLMLCSETLVLQALRDAQYSDVNTFKSHFVGQLQNHANLVLDEHFHDQYATLYGSQFVYADVRQNSIFRFTFLDGHTLEEKHIELRTNGFVWHTFQTRHIAGVVTADEMISCQGQECRTRKIPPRYDISMPTSHDWRVAVLKLNSATVWLYDHAKDETEEVELCWPSQRLEGLCATGAEEVLSERSSSYIGGLYMDTALTVVVVGEDTIHWGVFSLKGALLVEWTLRRSQISPVLVHFEPARVARVRLRDAGDLRHLQLEYKKMNQHQDILFCVETGDWSTMVLGDSTRFWKGTAYTLRDGKLWFYRYVEQWMLCGFTDLDVRGYTPVHLNDEFLAVSHVENSRGKLQIYRFGKEIPSRMAHWVRHSELVNPKTGKAAESGKYDSSTKERVLTQH